MNIKYNIDENIHAMAIQRIINEIATIQTKNNVYNIYNNIRYVLAVFTCMLFIILIEQTNIISHFATYLIVIILLVILFINYRIKQLQKFRVINIIERPTPLSIGKREIIIRNNGLHVISDYIESNVPWMLISKLVIEKDFIIIYCGHLPSYLIPVSAFKERSEMQNFTDIIANNMNSVKI